MQDAYRDESGRTTQETKSSDYRYAEAQRIRLVIASL
jgi:hypothetical protein